MWILGDSQRCSSRFHPHFTSSFPNYPKFQYWHWLFSPTRTPNSKGRLQTWIILPMHLFQRLQSVLFFLYHKFNYRFHPLSLGEVFIQCFLGWGWCIPLPLPARTRRPSLREIVDLGMTWSWLEHRRRGLMRVYVICSHGDLLDPFCTYPTERDSKRVVVAAIASQEWQPNFISFHPSRPVLWKVAWI